MKTAMRWALGAAVTTALSFGAVEQSYATELVALGAAKIDATSGNDVSIYFLAYENSDGSIAGGGLLDNKTLGVKIYFDVNSTEVVDGLTYLGGPVTQVEGPGPPVGFTAWFAVQDNGWGHPSPDIITNFFAGPPQALGTTVQSVLAVAGPIPPQFWFPLVYGFVKVY